MNLVKINCSGCNKGFEREKRSVNAALRKGSNMYCSNSCKASNESDETKEKKAIKKRANALAKFHASVNRAPWQGPAEECWQWTGTTDKGYGIASYDHKVWQAHRLSYYLDKGSIDDNLIIMHSCDNPPCVNPAHLTQGTKKDNSDDKVNKNRHNKGSQVHFSVIDESKVEKIRKQKFDGLTIPVIAKQWGVGERTVSDIVNKKTWAHVHTKWDKVSTGLMRTIEKTEEHRERFLSKIKMGSAKDCWEWQAYINEHGYGIFHGDEGLVSAHRFSYVLHKGEIAPGKIIRHLCNNKSCVNPFHLKEGTKLENAQDSIAAGTQVKGSQIRTAKLTEEQVKQIKVSLRDKVYSHTKLAEMYGVSKWSIDAISTGRYWSHVKLDE